MGNIKYFNEFVNEQDSIKGGKGDKTTPTDVDPKQLEIGIAVEMEHTDDKDTAKEIALDHLTEDPEYYTKLIKSGIADETDAIKIYNKYYGTEEE